MSRRLIKNKKGLAVRMSSLENLNNRCQSHQGLPFEPGWIIFQASWIIWPFSSKSTSWPSSLLMKSETWINQPWLFLRSDCSSSYSHRFRASLFVWKHDSSWYWIIILHSPSWNSGIICFNSGPSCFTMQDSKRAITGKKTLFQYSTTSSHSCPSI